MSFRLALLLSLTLACATTRPSPASAPTAEGAPKAAVLTFPPEEVTVSAAELDLAGKNDAELFALGTAAFGADDFRRAAAAFSRLADLHPTSSLEASALFNAGLSWQRAEEWRLALERFRTLERKYEGPDALEASFKVAECLYHLGELADARAALDGIARREGLEPDARIRALAQRGVVELEAGQPDEAERTLRLAVSTWQAASAEEPLDPYFAAQAQYYLGETYRAWFRALPLDPSKGDEARLQADLEHKSEMLLSAQGHYLRAIRMGNDRWAVGAGFRIGELYDELRRELLEAPLPPGLAADEAEAYRTELRRRVRVLAQKAITAYEQTLARASRTGVDDVRFLADARASLERLKEAIAEPGPGPRT